MKLYKIRSMFGDHGVSVFPPEDEDFPPAEEMAGEPMGDLVRKIMVKGYTEHEAYLAVQAWAYHAKYDLNQAARGVRVFCEMCARDIPPKGPPPEPVFWGVIIAVAVIAAIALALYVWAVLDQELNVTFGTHEWAYCMSYEERLWQGELWGVSKGNVGVYELGVNFGEVIESAARNIGYERWMDSLYFREGGMVLQGRRLIFYHVYRIKGFSVRFCGLLENAGAGLYRLREGGHDPYKPAGVWMRPGGRWGTPEYEGCWKKWWWL